MNKSNWFLHMLLPLMTFGHFGIVEGGGGGNEGGNEPSNEPSNEPDNEPSHESSNDSGEEGANKQKPKTTDAEAKLLKEVMDKKNALKKTAEEKAALELQLKAFEGIDPVAVKELLKQKAEQETKELEAKGDWERLKASMAEEHKAEKEALQAQLDALKGESENGKKIIDNLTVGQTFAQSEFIKDELALTVNKARVVYGDHFEHVDGVVVAYDKPKGAKERTMLVDASGEPMTFDAALRKIVDLDPDRDQLLRSKAKPGANSNNSPKQRAPEQKEPVELKGRDKIANALKSVTIK
jgi:hypothetical protein